MNESSTMHEDDSVNDELVAYLDHELDESDRQRVERRLAEDEAYREQLTQLQRSWDMLDALPRSSVSEAFTQTTVEMVALSTAHEFEHQALARRRWTWVAWGGGGIVAILLATFAYSIAAKRLSQPNAQLAADLPVIENLDEYRYLENDNVAFLQMLYDADVFAASEYDDENPTATPPSHAAQLLADPNSVSDDVRSELARKKARFEALAPSEQERLRRLHADLSGQPNAADLRVVLALYNDWMSAKPSTQRADLLKLNGDERLAEINRLVQQQEEERFRAYVRAKLVPQDHQVIERWLVDIARRREPELLENMDERWRDFYSRWQSEGEKKYFALLMPIFQSGRLTEFVASLSDEERQPLVDQLSKPANQAFAKLESDQKRDELLVEWVRAMLYSRTRPSVEEMKQFVAEHATPEEREKLENTPRERMEDELRDLYYRYRRMGPGGRSQFGGPRPGFGNPGPFANGRGSAGRGPDGRSPEGYGPDGHDPGREPRDSSEEGIRPPGPPRPFDRPHTDNPPPND